MKTHGKLSKNRCIVKLQCAVQNKFSRGIIIGHFTSLKRRWGETVTVNSYIKLLLKDIVKSGGLKRNRAIQ